MNITRDNANAHPLGRPASMPSLYSSTSSNNNQYDKSGNEDNEVLNSTSRTSLDSGNNDNTHGSYANAGSWQQHNNGWNHNNSCNNNSSSSSPPPINNNMSSNNTTGPSSSSTSRPSSFDLPSIHNYDKQHNTSPTMSSPSTTTANSNIISAYNSPTYFVSPTSTNTTTPYNNNNNNNNNNNSTHHYQQNNIQQQQGTGYSAYGMTSTNNMPNQTRHSLVARPKLTTTLWEDEGTICYQVDANGICVARRQDNDMINGTKLLNVAGMSRGKRDGILKNEKGRVVVKVGAMHLKGVWITFARAKLLAAQYKIQEILYPLFVDDPSVFLYATALHNPMASSRMNSLNTGFRNQQHFNNSGSSYSGNGGPSWDRHNTTTSPTSTSAANDNNTSSYRNAGFHGSMMNHPINSNSDDMFILSSQVDYNGRPPVGGGLVGYGSNNGANTTTTTATPNTGLSHSSSSYSVYPQQDHHQQRSSTGNSRMYFTEELLDDSGPREIKTENTNDTTPNSSYYGKFFIIIIIIININLILIIVGHNNKSMLPGTNSLSSPTSSEAGKSSSAFHLPPSRGSGEYDSTSSITSATTSTTTAERRQSLVMPGASRVSSPRHHPYMSPGKVYTPSIMSTLQSYRQSSDFNKHDDIDRTSSELDSSTTSDLNRHP
ncbi:hypothetical protein INT48_007504, partial [Thamnidium elegans]